MDNANGNEVYRSYLLPRAFWSALLDVRNHLIQDKEFFNRVYDLCGRQESLRSAFLLVDSFIDQMLIDEAGNY